jgi:hypothetical protein
MAYSNVTSLSNLDAVLGSIASFIGGLTGWTIHANCTAATVDTAGPSVAGGRVLIASNGVALVGLRSTVTGPGGNRLYLFDGQGPYSSGIEGSLNGESGLGSLYTNASVITTNGIAARGFQPLVGPFPNLYMFSNSSGDYVHIVLEWSTGKFRHMMFGNLIKFGTWPGGGGSYYCGGWWDQSGLGSSPGVFISFPGWGGHAIPFDNTVNQFSANGLAWTVNYSNGTDSWIANANDAMVGSVQRRKAVGSTRGGFGRMFKDIQESLFTGLIPLSPIMVGAVKQSNTPNTVAWIGQAPDVRLVNVQHLTPAQEFSIGSDTWKCFPMASKNGLPGQENSGAAGLAFKKI